MTALLPTLVATCFALAVGFLTPLVWIERPLLGLFWDVASDNIKDADVQRIFSAIHVVAHADAPKIVGIFGLSGMVLAVMQAWQYGFHWAAVLCATIIVVFNTYAFHDVRAVMKSVKGAHPRDEINKVRGVARKAMRFHYIGFMMYAITLLVQLVLVIGC